MSYGLDTHTHTQNHRLADADQPVSHRARRYISPVTMRARMAELVEDQACLRWWLPDDDGYTPLLQSLRAVADERNSTALAAQSDSRLQQTRHVFSRMQIGPAAGGAEKDASA